jgi:hypothetical protein
MFIYIYLFQAKFSVGTLVVVWFKTCRGAPVCISIDDLSKDKVYTFLIMFSLRIDRSDREEGTLSPPNKLLALGI